RAAPAGPSSRRPRGAGGARGARGAPVRCPPRHSAPPGPPRSGGTPSGPARPGPVPPGSGPPRSPPPRFPPPRSVPPRSAPPGRPRSRRRGRARRPPVPPPPPRVLSGRRFLGDQRRVRAGAGDAAQLLRVADEDPAVSGVEHPLLTQRPQDPVDARLGRAHQGGQFGLGQ